MPTSAEHLARGLRLEKSGALERALDAYTEALDATDDPHVLAEGWRRRSSVLRSRCEWDAAIDAARRSAAAAARAGLTALVGEAMNAEAAVYESRGEHERAAAMFEEIPRVTDDERVCGIALQNLGAIAAHAGDLALAERRFEASHDCFRRAAYAWGEAFALNNRGRVALERGDFERADALLASAIGAAQEVEDLDLKALAMLNRAEALARRGDFAGSEELMSGALGFFTFAGNEWRRIECFRLLGDICAWQGSSESAVRCWRQGLAVAATIGASREHAELARRIAAAEAPPPAP